MACGRSERRRSRRVRLSGAVRLATRAEQPVPGGQLVDVSATGADGRQYIGIEYASMGQADTRRLRTLVERYEAGDT